MTTLPDLLYVALFAVALPLWDYLVFWPAFRRELDADPTRARRRLWTGAIVYPWALVALGAALWTARGLSWITFGFAVPDGWRLWTSIALFVLGAAYYLWMAAILVRSREARTRARQQVGTLAGVMPHTRTEMYRFGAASLTAGFCEEFLYRGYFVWTFSDWLGWWGAAVLSVPFFAIAHVYQGWNGVLHVGVLATFYTLVVAILDSLWPAIVLHALVDLGNGIMGWLVLRSSHHALHSPAS